MHKGGGGGVQLEIPPKKLGTKKLMGVQFEIIKNPGIDLYSGFRKTCIRNITPLWNMKLTNLKICWFDLWLGVDTVAH